MKYLALLVFCLFSVGSVFTQNQKVIDSLEFELDQNQKDSVEVRILNDLAYYYLYQDIDTCLIYGNRALLKANKLNMFKAKTRANLYIGNAFMYSNRYDSARHYFNTALKIAKKYDVNQSAIYSSFGILHKAEGNYEKAIETYFTGINYDEETNNEYGKFYKTYEFG